MGSNGGASSVPSAHPPPILYPNSRPGRERTVLMNKSARDFHKALRDAYRIPSSPLDPETIEEVVSSRNPACTDSPKWTAEECERIWWRTSG